MIKVLESINDFFEDFLGEIIAVLITALFMSFIGTVAVREAVKNKEEQLNAAKSYIKELESSVDEDYLLDVLAEGDAYCQYYTIIHQ